MEREYSVTADRYVKSVTIGVIALLASFFVLIPLYIYVKKGNFSDIYYVIALMLALYIPIILGAWAYSPQKYIVSDKEIIIKRPLKSIEIPVERISRIEKSDLNAMRALRLFGNGGLFSITGRFWSKELGTMYFYAKNRNYVLIHADKLYVLSPDKRDEFIEHLRGLM